MQITWKPGILWEMTLCPTQSLTRAHSSRGNLSYFLAEEPLCFTAHVVTHTLPPGLETVPPEGTWILHTSWPKASHREQFNWSFPLHQKWHWPRQCHVESNRLWTSYNTVTASYLELTPRAYLADRFVLTFSICAFTSGISLRYCVRNLSAGCKIKPNVLLQSNLEETLEGRC